MLNIFYINIKIILRLHSNKYFSVTCSIDLKYQIGMNNLKLYHIMLIE